ncbi:MAG TPA: hypothetical protein VK025_14545 [Steroidobacter sp.]|jgi:hypothetical protein|nr:hypothetical protein [Steroidobacteraceae bacterium]HLS82616.1 hypothetical protein [Steroidobacter sp.]
MKTHFAIGAALLLTLGSAVAGSLIIGSGESARAVSGFEAQIPASQLEATPDLIVMWKATAASTEYSAPKAPI